MIVNKETCPHCGQSINERQIGLFKGMVESLWQVYCWCVEKNRHEFERKDVKHLFSSENITARFGDWVFFGGLVYKHGKGHYGLNMERCEAFFGNKLAIPTLITKHPITKEIERYEPRLAKEIPSLMQFLDDDSRYVAMYGKPYQLTFS